jgi:hypothetical protein
MAAQAAAITLVAALVPHRLLLVVVAIAAAAAGLALGFPGDFDRTPGALLLDFSGVFAGLALGWIGIEVRLRRERGATARRHTVRHGPPRGEGVRAMVAGVVAIVVLALGAAGWHYFGDGVPLGWRLAAEKWIGPVETRTPSARVPAGSNQPTALPAGAKGAAPAADAKPRERPRTERPQGDLRHCLQQGSPQDVAKCAEGG